MQTSRSNAPSTSGSLPIDGYLRVSQLVSLLQLSRTTLWRLERANALPASLKIGRSKLWRVDQIREFIASHGAGQDLAINKG